MIIFNLVTSAVTFIVLANSFQMFLGTSTGKNSNHTFENPSQNRLNYMVITLAIIGGIIVWTIRHLSLSEATEFYRSLGIRFSKMTRTAFEIERKTFHLMGLGVNSLSLYIHFHVFLWC